MIEEFRDTAVRLRLEPILRFQRCHDVDAIVPPILDVAKQMMALAEQLAEPRVVFVTRAVARLDARSLSVHEGPTFGGGCFASQLDGAREVVAFLATLGPALDERATALGDGKDLLEAVFLQTAGWLALEDVVRAFRGHLAARVRQEQLRPSPRLAPGYLDWPLAEQASLFSLFDGAPLPVALSEYSVMTPTTSVSGLFGLIPAAAPS